MLSNITLNKEQKLDLSKIILSSVILILANFLDINTNIKFGMFVISYLIVGYEVLLSALYNIKSGEVFDENFLMSIATIGAFILREYSEGVFVMLFYAVGELFENIAVGRSRNSIQSLLEYAPEEARVLRGGIEEIVDPDEVEIGEIISVLVGEKIPLDGKVIEGESSLNMAFLTGESIPVDVKIGDKVASGSINLSRVLKIETTSTFDDSTVSKILELIEESTEKKSVLENFITRFARYYTPIVVLSALALALLPPLILGGGWSTWIQRALIFLVVSCPCALVVSIPLSFFGGIGKASREGILVKGSNYLEVLSMLETVVFDKTGTLTEGVFEIVEEISHSDKTWKEYTGALESYSNHPIAESIVKSYGNNLKNQIKDVEEIQGKGIVGYINGIKVSAGNDKLMEDLGIKVPIVEKVGTKVHVAFGEELVGTIVISDIVKPDAKEVLADLKDMGIKNLALLTGDRDEVAQSVAKELGINKVYSELLPEEKVLKLEEMLKEKSEKTSVAYVGDGINDAPVLTLADVGIAMGALGSDVAIESADIVLMKDELSKLPKAIKISKKTTKIAKQNVVLALGIKLSVLALSVFGIATMWMAIFADVGVLVLAVLNSMRTLK